MFNRHEGVLLGINESIPSFAAFEAVLDKYRDRLDIKLLIEWYYARLGRLRTKRIDGLRWWDYDSDRKMLGDTCGGMALRCRLTKPVRIAARLQKDVVLTAGAYAAGLRDYSVALQTLAPIVPAEAVNRPFPGTRQSKLELLNGWQAPRRWRPRAGYKRARWFLRRDDSAESLSFGVRRVRDGAGATLTVLVNGLAVSRMPLTRDWSECLVPIKAIEKGQIFICELQLSLDPEPDGAAFEDFAFEVKSRRFVTSN